MTSEKTGPGDFLGLKTRREALRLTLKGICQSTRVSVVNLEAIENGEFHDLPVPIYTKNFIKTYARALDVDSKPILESYEAYLASLKVDQTPIPEAVPEKEQKPFSISLAPYKKYVATAAVIFIVAVVTIVILRQPQPKPPVALPQPVITATAPKQAAVTTPVNPPEQAASVKPSMQAAPPKAVAPPVVSAAIKQTPPALPSPAQQKKAAPLQPSLHQNIPVVEKKAPVSISEGTDVLVIQATEETWLRMTIDQNPPFQVLLKPGQELKRKGAGFVVDIGNAGGVKMQFKGKSIENQGNLRAEFIHPGVFRVLNSRK